MKKTACVNVIEAPESVSKIDKAFIKKFAESATPKQKNWIKYNLKKEIEENGARDGFFSFRSLFAKKYFPEIYAPKKPKKEFLDEIWEICG